MKLWIAAAVALGAARCRRAAQERAARARTTRLRRAAGARQPRRPAAADPGVGQAGRGGAYTLKSGSYYRIDIVADGTAEMALSGGDFFRAVWVNEIVINDIEVRPMGVHSIEFDAAGTAQHVVHRHRARHVQAVDPRLHGRHPERDLRHPVRPTMKRIRCRSRPGRRPGRWRLPRRRARSSRPGSTRCWPAMQCEVDPANVEVEDGELRPRRRDVRRRSVRHQARRGLRGDRAAQGVIRGCCARATARKSLI